MTVSVPRVKVTISDDVVDSVGVPRVSEVLDESDSVMEDVLLSSVTVLSADKESETEKLLDGVME